jgi:hypothetical protein
VTYKAGFGLDDSIYCTLYIYTVRNYWRRSAIAILHTLQFTVTHALAFSVFISHILATDLSQSHFKSHMKSSYHSLIPYLSFLLRAVFHVFCGTRRLFTGSQEPAMVPILSQINPVHIIPSILILSSEACYGLDIFFFI